MNDSPSTNIVILAAGASSRMGEHKLLLEVDGKTLLQRAAATALEVSPEVLVVLGRDATRLSASLDGYSVRFVVNPDYANGKIQTSLQTAIAVLESRATLLMLADMPLISAAMLKSVVQIFLEQRPKIVASRFGTVLAPPHLFAPELLAVLGTSGAKPLIMQHLEATVFLDWEKEKLFDVDTPQDFATLQKLFKVD